MEDFLRENSLLEFLPAFEREKITVDLLEDLDDDLLEKVIPQVGPRIRLRKFLLEWKKKQNNIAPTATAVNNQINDTLVFEVSNTQESTESNFISVIGFAEEELTEVVQVDPLANSTPTSSKSNSNTEVINLTASNSNTDVINLTASNSNTDVINPTASTSKSPAVSDSSAFLQAKVEEYCEKLGNLFDNSTVDGKLLSIYASEKRTLTEDVRATLVDLIVKSELSAHPKFKVPSSVFKYYSLAIQKTFVGERASAYFIDYVYLGNNKKKSARGKLVDKYGNKRTALRRLKLLSPIKKSEQEELATEESNDNNLILDENLTWLENNVEPWPLIVKKWRESFAKRIPLLRTTLSIQAFLNKFPCLQLSDKGFELLREDFDKLYPDKGENFHLHWGLVAEKIIEYSKEKAGRDKSWKKLIENNGILLEAAIGTRNVQLAALKLLPFLLSPPAIITCKSKGLKWKPSRLEHLEGLIFNVKSPGDLENAITQRIIKLNKYGLSFQPLTVVVDSKEAVAAQVVLESFRYVVPTPMEAFDVCYKMFFVFNVEYPAESISSFLFIQKYVYKMPLKVSQACASIETLATSLKL